jgi:hypothetical protein
LLVQRKVPKRKDTPRLGLATLNFPVRLKPKRALRNSHDRLRRHALKQCSLDSRLAFDARRRRRGSSPPTSVASIEELIPLGDAEVCRGEREMARRCLSEQGERVYVEPRTSQSPRVSALADEPSGAFLWLLSCCHKKVTRPERVNAGRNYYFL